MTKSIITMKKLKTYIIESTQGGHFLAETEAISLEQAKDNYLEGQGVIIREKEAE